MHYKTFEAFCNKVRVASYADGIWRWHDYWKQMTPKQCKVMEQILDHHPAVMKMERNGKKVYQLPNGKEWEAY